MKKLAQGFNTAAHDSNQDSLSRGSEALPLSHCALPRRLARITDGQFSTADMPDITLNLFNSLDNIHKYP